MPAVEAKIYLPFNAGWSHYGTGFQPGAYYKDPFGIVHLGGLVQHTTDRNSAIATLPVGYRPAFQELFTTMQQSGLGRLDVTAAGVLQPSGGSGGGWVSLDGLTFRAA